MPLASDFNKTGSQTASASAHQKVADMSKADADRIIELQAKIRQATIIQYGIGSAGTAAGVYFAYKTGGGAGRYIGFGILGGIVLGGLGYALTLSQINKAVTEIEKIQTK